MARSLQQARKKKTMKNNKRPHEEEETPSIAVVVAQAEEPPPTTAAAAAVSTGEDQQEEVEWKDDDFLALGSTMSLSSDPKKKKKKKIKKKKIKKKNQKVDVDDDDSTAGAAGSYDSMEQNEDDMEESESSSDSSSSGGDYGVSGTPPWLMLHHINHRQQQRHQQQHHHRHRSSAVSPLVDLHNEMLQFVKLMEPLEPERVARLAIIRELQDAVQDEFGPSAQLLVLGSQATGLFLPTSDIDLTLQYTDDDDHNNNNNNNNNNNKEAQSSSSYNPLYKKPIHRFGDLMASKQWKDRLSYLETIAATRVPIVKMRLADTDIAVDVSFNQQNGVTAAALMTEYLKAMPPLRPLTIILKYFLAARDLNEPYSGGVGSYLLQLLIVSFLQQRERAAYHDNFHLDYNLGALLLDFLELYGLDFNYLVTGLSVRFDGFYYRKGHAARFNCVSVENPLDVDHDVGSSSYRFTMVQRSFAIAYKTLMAMITPGPKPAAAPAVSSTATTTETRKNHNSVLGSILPTSPYMISRLVVKRRDMALSAPRDNNVTIATTAAATARGRRPPPPPSVSPRAASAGNGGVDGALAASRFGRAAAPDPRKKRKTDY
jgi:non-canonical poly(A) RNA polymerase PAPD5/7